jgi:hypothetical protein
VIVVKTDSGFTPAVESRLEAGNVVRVLIDRYDHLETPDPAEAAALVRLLAAELGLPGRL